MQPYESVSLLDAAEGFRKQTKGISQDNNIGDDIFNVVEGDSVGLRDNTTVAGDVIFMDLK